MIPSASDSWAAGSRIGRSSGVSSRPCGKLRRGALLCVDLSYYAANGQITWAL